MPRTLALRGAALALLLLSSVPGAALAAQGISLAWDHCLADGGIQNKVFACDTNSGENRLVGTFQLGSNMSNVVAAEIVLQLATAGVALPAWWDVYNAGSCRPTALSVNSSADPGDVSCPDWSGGQMFVGIGAYCGSAGTCVDHPALANQVRIKLVEAVAQQFATTLTGGQEYFAFNLVIQNAKTVGTGSCPGCLTPACIVLNSIDVIAAGDAGHRKLTTASSPGGNYVTWQGGGGTNCPAATPARNSTWGSVKSLYR